MMSDQILGLLNVFLICCLFYFSFKSYKVANYKYAILFILLAGFSLRLFAGADLFLHEWDERYHALVAKNLIKHPLTPTLYDDPVLDYDYKDWMRNNVWLHKQPLALWLMALSMKLFGINEIALRLPSITLSTTAIFFTYYIGAYIFSNKVGLLAASFHAINGFLIQLAAGKRSTDHIDSIFCFFIELGIFLSVVYLKKKNNLIIFLLIGITTGLAVLTKWLPGLLVIAVWYALIFRKENYKIITCKLLALFIISLALFLPWQFYIHYSFPNEASWESHYNFIHTFKAVESHTGSIFYYIGYMPKIFSYLIYIPIGWFFLVLVKQNRDYKLIPIAVWFFLPYLFFSLVATKMRAYIMISAPAVFLIEAYLWWSLKECRYNLKYKKFRYALLVLLILLPVIQCIKTVKPYKNYVRNPEWAQNLRSLKDRISDKKAILFTDRPIETMFYSPYTAYSFAHDKEQIKRLNEKGYKVFVVDKDGIILDTNSH